MRRPGASPPRACSNLPARLVAAPPGRRRAAPRAAALDAPTCGASSARSGPAVVGSAGVQIAIFADTIIASFLPTGAVSSLYYADRLYQLPVGVIGIAAGTVLLPEMSRRLAAGDVARRARRAEPGASGLRSRSRRPSPSPSSLIPDLIMAALFQRGAFDAAAAEARRRGARRLCASACRPWC